MPDWCRRCAVIATALLLDLAFGDPPNRYHPVAWMGAAIDVAQRRAPRHGRLLPLLYGAGLALGGTAAVGAFGTGLAAALSRLPALPGLLAEAAALKSALGMRGLARAAADIQVRLERGELDEARRLLGWHLVSRDTSALDPGGVAAATIESVAENTSDGVVAPLLYYFLGGLPAALGYRFINTADAMLGYRDAAREWLGKVPARLDDGANLLPARLTAGACVVGAALTGADPRRAWRIWRRDAGTTASPNAGHPMSAMAGALGVELEKVGHYRLGAGQPKPHAGDITSALRLMGGAVVVAFGLMVAVARLLGHDEDARHG